MNKHFYDIEEVEDFFRYLVNDRKVNLNPDDNFVDYVNLETKEPTFSEYEVRLFNEMMDEAFDFCEDNGYDIYEIAYDILWSDLKKGFKVSQESIDEFKSNL